MGGGGKGGARKCYGREKKARYQISKKRNKKEKRQKIRKESKKEKIVRKKERKTNYQTQPAYLYLTVVACNEILGTQTF